MGKYAARGAVLAFFIWILCLGLQHSGGLTRLDNAYFDLWHQLAGVRHPPQHTVIIAIDDATLEEHRDTPLVCWTPLFAQTVAVLRQVGAAAIGLDYLFAVNMEAWLQQAAPDSQASRTFDQPFKSQLASGAAVLAATVVADDHDRTRVRLPREEFFHSLPRGLLDVGLANFPSDADGVVRRFWRALAVDDGRTLLTLGELLARRAQGRDPGEVLAQLQHQGLAAGLFDAPKTGPAGSTLPRIGFVGPPDTVPRLSCRRLLRPGAAAAPEIQALKGKVAIIAYEPSGIQDIHATPYAMGLVPGGGDYMTGPEVHANIVETVLTGRYPRSLEGAGPALILLLAAVAGVALFLSLSTWRGLAAAVLLAVLLAVAAYRGFLADLILPAAASQVALGLAYVGVLGLKLAGEERERRRLRQIFGRYVSQEVVEKLLASGGHPDLGGEGYRVTVLFSDIRNFTTLSEKLSAREVVEALNTYFSRAVEPILAAGGTVDKFIGDAVMAVFGAPVAYPDHARRALGAALALVKTADEFRAWMRSRFPGRDLPEFRVGVGLHTGEAIVGNLGSPKRLEYTAIGDTVNTASRLEGLCKDLGWTIVASRAVLAASGPGVVVGGEAVRQVKGRREPVAVVEILGLDDNAPETT